MTNYCMNHSDRPVASRGLCTKCLSAARRRGVADRFPTKVAPPSARLCLDCGRPVTRGRTCKSGEDWRRCLVCEVGRSLAGFRYPVARRLR